MKVFKSFADAFAPGVSNIRLKRSPDSLTKRQLRNLRNERRVAEMAAGYKWGGNSGFNSVYKPERGKSRPKEKRQFVHSFEKIERQLSYGRANTQYPEIVRVGAVYIYDMGKSKPMVKYYSQNQ
jgi:hypothetical protein